MTTSIPVTVEVAPAELKAMERVRDARDRGDFFSAADHRKCESVFSRILRAATMKSGAATMQRSPT